MLCTRLWKVRWARTRHMSSIWWSDMVSMLISLLSGSQIIVHVFRYLPTFYKIFCLLKYINFYVEKGVLKKQSQGSISICNCFPHSLLFPFHHEVPWRLKLELVPYHHKINRYWKYLEIDMIISDYICSPDPRIMGLYVKVIIWLQNNHHLPMHIIIVIIQTLLDQSS